MNEHKKEDFNAEHVTIKLSINSKGCTTFTTDVPNVRRLQRHKLQGEDPDCGGVAAAHYGGVGTRRSVCHRQRSEAVVHAPPCLCRCKRRTFLTAVVNVIQLLLILLGFLVT